MSLKENDVYYERLEELKEPSFKKSPDRDRKGKESFDSYLEQKEREERSNLIAREAHEPHGHEPSF